MSEQSASRSDQSSDPNDRSLLEQLPPAPRIGAAGRPTWLEESLGSGRTPGRPQELLLSPGDVLRCREQALYAAAMMGPEVTAFAEEDGDVVVALARRFERYLVEGV